MNQYKFSLRSEKNLQGVNSDLIKLVRQALTLSEIDFGITEGLRAIEKQKQLVKEGKSRTMNSRHLSGHAVDIIAYLAGEASWEFNDYKQIAKAFKEASIQLKIPLEWGGDWPGFRDGPHFQLPWKYYPL